MSLAFNISFTLKTNLGKSWVYFYYILNVERKITITIPPCTKLQEWLTLFVPEPPALAAGCHRMQKAHVRERGVRVLKLKYLARDGSDYSSSS